MADPPPPPAASDAADTSSRWVHQQTETQMEAIEETVRSSQPLTSDPITLSVLAEESSYSAESNFAKGLQHLEQEGYRQVRKVRGDGNCFYRAFLYRLLEIVTEEERLRILKLVKESMDQLEKRFGYDRFTVEMFWEDLVELLETAPTQDDNSGSSSSSSSNGSPSLHSILNQENGTSDTCTWYLRVLTAARLKSDPDRFIHFVEEPDVYDIPTFCRRCVEPMGKECTMVMITALTEWFGVQVVIEYLDGHTAGRPMQHVFGEEQAKTALTLLYRPGHYDILYK